jgi:hypothetical protein
MIFTQYGEGGKMQIAKKSKKASTAIKVAFWVGELRQAWCEGLWSWVVGNISDYENGKEGEMHECRYGMFPCLSLESTQQTVILFPS